jgi:hypothetical protein
MIISQDLNTFQASRFSYNFLYLASWAFSATAIILNTAAISANHSSSAILANSG